MARIWKRPHRLQALVEKLRYRSHLLIWLYIAVAGAVVVLGDAPNNLTAMFLVLLFGFVLVGLVAHWSNTALILAVGEQGERLLIQMLQNLPDDYEVLSDLVVEVEGRRSQIDHVVVGPDTVWVIEGKHYKGHIIGSEDAPEWSLKKLGRGGTEYERKFYNPVKQVRTHMHRLKQFCERNYGLRVWMEPVVVFTHPDVRLSVRSRSRVIRGDQLLIALTNARGKGRRRLASDDRQQLLRILSEILHREFQV